MEGICMTNLLSINKFANEIHFLLNYKRHTMHCHTRQNINKTNLNIYVNNSYIDQLETTTLLGLLISSKISLGIVTSIIQKERCLSTELFVLRKMAKYFSIETLELIYYAHIQFCLCYSIVCFGWSTSDKKNLKRILILKK